MGTTIPLFPLGTVLFPGDRAPLRIFEDRYLRLLDDLAGHPGPEKAFGIVAIRRGHEVGADRASELYEVGCLAVIEALDQDGAGVSIVVRGTRRFRIDRLVPDSTPYPRAEVTLLPEPTGSNAEVADRESAARRAFAAYVGLVGAGADLPEDDPIATSYAIAAGIRLQLADRQRLLEADSAADRLALATRLLHRERQFITRWNAVPGLPDLGGASLN